MASLSMPTSQRDQAMLAVGILGILAIAAYWYFVFQPKSAEIALISAHVEKLDASNNRARALLARGTVEELQAEAQMLQDNLATLRRLIPSGNEVPALLDQIVGAARRTGLQVQSFTPGPLVQGEQFDTYRYSMNMSGSYHEIAELLTNIGSLQRIIAPVNLRLTPVAVPPGQGGATTTVRDRQQLSAAFDIQTYVVKATDEGTPR